MALYERHYTLLRQWNEQINLVSRKSIDLAFASQYADSLQIAHLAEPYVKDLPVFDVGSGAGFPGLIFAIRFPETHITLFEKSLKKQSFLTAAITELKLPNVELRGAFPEEAFEGFFFARAVFPRDELFRFFQKRSLPGSMLVTNLGGTGDVAPPPKAFRKEGEARYALPLDAGERRIEIFSLCST